VDYLRLAKGTIYGSFATVPVAHLNHLYDVEQYIPAGIEIPTSLDLSLLRMAEMTKVPSSEAAALPWFPTTRKFNAAFVGINKSIDADANVVASFPQVVTQKKIQACIDALKPMRLSMAAGHAEFTRIDVHPLILTEECVHDQEIYADAISYDISTSPGSSGSAITGLTMSRELYGAQTYQPRWVFIANST
jgi:hypothetical protein